MSSYKTVYKHGHANAGADGRILEHVFVMSEMLGRALTDLEVVHHVDENKGNNAPKNLQLFATAAEHNSHHMHLKALQVCGNPDYRRCSLCKTYDAPEKMALRKGNEQYHHRACKDLYNSKTRSTPEGRAKANAANTKARAKKKLLLTQLEKQTNDKESID